MRNVLNISRKRSILMRNMQQRDFIIIMSLMGGRSAEIRCRGGIPLLPTGIIQMKEL